MASGDGSMSANEIGGTGIPLPRMAEVRAVAPLTLLVTWAEGARAGRTDCLDLAPVIETFKSFRLLRKNESLFATARLGEAGDTVAWAGDNLEMHAEAIELLAEQTMSQDLSGSVAARF